jgi:hypothetical protein
MVLITHEILASLSNVHILTFNFFFANKTNMNLKFYPPPPPRSLFCKESKRMLKTVPISSNFPSENTHCSASVHFVRPLSFPVCVNSFVLYWKCFDYSCNILELMPESFLCWTIGYPTLTLASICNSQWNFDRTLLIEWLTEQQVLTLQSIFDITRHLFKNYGILRASVLVKYFVRVF